MVSLSCSIAKRELASASSISWTSRWQIPSQPAMSATTIRGGQSASPLFSRTRLPRQSRSLPEGRGCGDPPRQAVSRSMVREKNISYCGRMHDIFGSNFRRACTKITPPWLTVREVQCLHEPGPPLVTDSSRLIHWEDVDVPRSKALTLGHPRVTRERFAMGRAANMNVGVIAMGNGDQCPTKRVPGIGRHDRDKGGQQGVQR